jgi:23S rRNA pseudouridine1911/1915/1917 synthase
LVAALEQLHRVPSTARGERLDQHLATALPDLSRSRLKALIEDGRVLLNGRTCRPGARLKGGEEIAISVPAPTPAKPIAQDLPIEVLFQDRSLIVVNKAAGMVVHPGAGHSEGTLVNALLHRVKDLGGVGGELRPGIVHRLDRETSGCMVVAKDEKTLAALQRSFKAREVTKLYLALVHGAPKAEGRFETLYGRHPKHRKRFTTKVREGKPALTLYRVLEQFDGAALVEADLRTGRTHQVRVHFAEAGHPLLADGLYGGGRKAKGAVKDATEAVGRQALHAWKLALAHPRTGKPLAFEAPIPEDFERALKILRANA